MSPSVTCYTQPSKPKSQRVCEAFAAGVPGGARIEPVTRAALADGDVAFYGVRPAWVHLWRQAQTEGRRWYYLDNSWFDAGRERFFRVGLNATQCWSQGPSDGTRLAALGVVPQWRDRRGRRVLVCRQSDEFLRCVAGWQGGRQRQPRLARVLREPARHRMW